MDTEKATTTGLASGSPHSSDRYEEHPRKGSVVGGSDVHGSSNREEDFMTRNGLNLRSFQRRKSVNNRNGAIKVRTRN